MRKNRTVSGSALLNWNRTNRGIPVQIIVTLITRTFSLPFQITFSVILRTPVALIVVFVSYMPEIMILAAGSTRQLTTTSGACLQNRKWVNFRKLKVLIRAAVGVHMPSKMMSKKLVKSRRRRNSIIWLVYRSIFTKSCFFTSYCNQKYLTNVFLIVFCDFHTIWDLTVLVIVLNMFSGFIFRSFFQKKNYCNFFIWHFCFLWRKSIDK